MADENSWRFRLWRKKGWGEMGRGGTEETKKKGDNGDRGRDKGFSGSRGGFPAWLFLVSVSGAEARRVFPDIQEPAGVKSKRRAPARAALGRAAVDVNSPAAAALKRSRAKPTAQRERNFAELKLEDLVDDGPSKKPLVGDA